jgi:ElaB/YqjD/DUF883 family membrane-anchored ribosome-binding protein
MTRADAHRLTKNLEQVTKGVEGLSSELNKAIKEIKPETLTEEEKKAFEQAQKEASKLQQRLDEQRKQFENYTKNI